MSIGIPCPRASWEPLAFLDVTQTVDTQERFEGRLKAWLRYWMERRGLGPTEAAELLGKHQSYVTRWLQDERGDRGSSAFMAYRLAKAFGIDPDHLFNKDPDATYWRTYVPHSASRRGAPSAPLERPAPSGPKPHNSASREP